MTVLVLQVLYSKTFISVAKLQEIVGNVSHKTCLRLSLCITQYLAYLFSNTRTPKEGTLHRGSLDIASVFSCIFQTVRSHIFF